MVVKNDGSEKIVEIGDSVMFKSERDISVLVASVIIPDDSSKPSIDYQSLQIVFESYSYLN